MKHILPTIVALLLSTPAALHAADASLQKPNIIVIMADDLSHRNLGCYGAANFETPHIDNLAAGGMRFEHCYSMPLCTPSRVALMTGQHNGFKDWSPELMKKVVAEVGPKDVVEDIGSGVSKDAAQWNEGVTDDEALEPSK